MAGIRARRYAKAIFELANEEHDLDGWRRQIEELRQLLKHELVRAVLANPVLPINERVQTAEELGQGRLGQGALNLARMLTSAGAVGLIDDIADAYSELVDEAQGRVRAVAVAAVDLSDADRKRISSELSKRIGKQVELEVRSDPRIVGGLLLQIGDRVIDGTLAARLHQLRRSLVA